MLRAAGTQCYHCDSIIIHLEYILTTLDEGLM